MTPSYKLEMDYNESDHYFERDYETEGKERTCERQEKAVFMPRPKATSLSKNNKLNTASTNNTKRDNSKTNIKVHEYSEMNQVFLITPSKGDATTSHTPGISKFNSSKNLINTDYNQLDAKLQDEDNRSEHTYLRIDNFLNLKSASK